MKRLSVLLITTEIQLQAISLGWLLPKKKSKTASVGKDTEKLEHLCSIGKKVIVTVQKQYGGASKH